MACEVLVLGGDLAGLLVALELAESGVDVVLVEPRALGEGPTGRGHGLLHLATAEPPHRLIEALGLVLAREYAEFSRESARTISVRLPLEGSLIRVAGRFELAELDRAVEASEALGLPCEALDAQTLSGRVGVEGLGPGRQVQGDACFDPGELLGRLARLALEAGATLLFEHEVQALELESSVRAKLGSASLEAELVVFAGGAELATLEPSFAHTLSPVRHQVLLAQGLASPPRTGLSASAGHLYWNPLHPEGLLAGGARWATPHMEVGEDDDSVVVERVHAAIEGWAHGVLGPFRCGPRWSRVQSFSCDHLPIVGPLPGHSRLLACTGFGDDEAALAGAAAKAVVAGILGLPPRLPTMLRASRFLA